MADKESLIAQGLWDHYNDRPAMNPPDRGENGVPRNQCDGCCRGLPVSEGLHRDESGTAVMACTADRYLRVEDLDIPGFRRMNQDAAPAPADAEGGGLKEPPAYRFMLTFSEGSDGRALAEYAHSLRARLAAVTAERDEAQRMVKNLAPTGRYNGLDIEQWKQRAEQAEAREKGMREEMVEILEDMEFIYEHYKKAGGPMPICLARRFDTLIADACKKIANGEINLS